MRVAGIDYGKVRIGVAISDPNQMIASPLLAIQAKKTSKETAQEIANTLASYMPIEAIVIGLPLMMNGKESPGCTGVRELGDHLNDITGLKIIFWDERLTTAQVERTLKEASMNRKKRTKYVDAMAASAILQCYLDTTCIK